MPRTVKPSATVPVFDVTRQYRALKRQIDRAMADVCDSGSFILGPNVKRFEEEFARYHHAAHAVGVASGTDALELGLRAAGVEAGDEVITSPFTFIATSEAIQAIGAMPVFVDIDPRTYVMDPAQIERKITKRTKALLPVHLYGQPADMDAIGAIVKRHGLLLLEDCAQATGATFRGQQVGTFGVAGCFSFYPTKNIGAYGDGGIVITNDAGVAKRLRMLRMHGGADKFNHEIQGRNSRLDELQAVVLRIKLPHLDEWNRRRRQLAQQYTECFNAAKVRSIVLPIEAPNTRHIYHLYVVRVPQRDVVRQGLADAGITTGIHYPIPLHKEIVYRSLGCANASLPQAERAAAETLTLPLFPELTEREVRRVVDALVRVCGGAHARARAAVSSRRHS